MLLSDGDLRKAMEEGELDIDPFEEKCLTPNGYDLSVESVRLPAAGTEVREGKALIPGMCWFLVSTRESVRLGRGIAAQLWLRSSFARRGVLASFGKVDAGFAGTLTVSAFNASAGPLELGIGERFCQMVFEQLARPADMAYAERSGNYQNQRGITTAKAEAPRERPAAREGGGPAGPATHAGTPAPAGASESAGGKGGGNAPPTARLAPPAPVARGQEPPAPNSPCRRHGCSLCCRSTLMPLTNEDVRRLTALGYPEGSFTEKVGGWVRLRNDAAGDCYFLKGGLCSVYPHRPEGCRAYPLVVDADSGEAVLDPECPHGIEFCFGGSEGREVRRLVEGLERERRQRKVRKVRIEL